MKRILNVLLILAFAFNQAVFFHPVQAAAVSQSQPAASEVGAASNRELQPAAAVATAQPTRPARPTPTPVSTPAPTEPVATPEATARFPKPPQPDPVFSEQSAQRVQRGGGEITGLDGRLKMKFASDTLAEDANLWVAPVDQEHMPPTTLSGKPFQIVAQGKNSKQSIRKFDQKATIELSYDPKDWGGNESSLVLYYYNESNEQWVPLPSRVDTQRHVLIATTDHLTIFDADAKSWEAARLPSVKEWQVSNFTGAATYSYPLQMPEGPGGLKPSLTLSYNSQVVDAATLETQASWVGMGWSLDTGYIRRNMNGTPDDVNDDTFSMVIGGMEHTLLLGSDGFYHTADETFWRAQMNGANLANNSSWTVWDKAGTVYQFGDQALYLIFYNCHDVMNPDGTETRIGVECDEAHPVWRWSMTKVRNIFGQELTYTYTHERKNLVFGIQCGSGTPDSPYRECIFWADTAVYPDTITYPNNRYQIVFERSGRNDYGTFWAAQNSARMFFERQKLHAVNIKQDSNGNGDYETLVHRYEFVYAAANEAHIFNGYTWNQGDKTLTLRQVKEYGLNGAGPLPATTFTYDANNLHLQEADNGQGGEVIFAYERVRVTENLPRADVDDHLAPFPQVWVETLGDITGNSAKTMGNERVRPGGSYRLVGKFNAGQTNTRQISLKKQGVEVLVLTAASGAASVEGIVDLPADPGYGDISVVMSCPTGCTGASFYVEPLLTRYRVTQKQLSDGLGNPAQVYTYAYNGAATNDPAHSAIVATTTNYCTDSNHDNDLCYSPAYTEFRGHSSTTETGPDGRSTTTWFHQDDERVGQAHTTQVTKGPFYENFTSSPLNTSIWNPVLNGGTQTIEPLLGESALKLTNPGASQTAWVKRVANSYVLGKMVQFQFQVEPSSTSTRAFFFIDTDQTAGEYNRWGFTLAADGRLVTSIYQAGAIQTENELMGGNVFQRGHWYLVWLAVSNNKLMMRVRDRDNPTIVARYEAVMPADAMNNRTWHFSEALREGTVWMDDYREEDLYQLGETLYTSTNNLVTTVYPTKEGVGAYHMAPIHWVASTWQKTFTFEGGAESVVKKVENYYDPALQAVNLPSGNNVQHGNLTHTQESVFDGSVFVPYRGTLTNYNSFIDANHYLVGLPNEAKQFNCPPPGCVSNGVPNNYVHLLNYTRYFYDDNPASQSMGKLTAERRLLRWEGSDPRYSDLDYGYDAWGNQVSVTQYTQEGTGTVRATAGAQKSVTCYGAAIAGETCTDDGYHTYPLWQKNALGQVTSIAYNYALGLPNQLTDPNLAISVADYDAYGRVVKIARPGDTLASPTIQVTYYDTVIPFWTQATQKTSATQSFSVRKFYNGLGELIQTQQVGVKVDDAACSAATCTVVVDQKVEYINGVKKSSQTAPYAIATSSGYATPTWQNVTVTTSDVLGRSTKIETPTDQVDLTSTRMMYSIAGSLFKTTTWDPKNNATKSWKDVWGRVAQVTAADGPVLVYNYDIADRLTSIEQHDRVNYNLLATTSLTYDIAGRKIQMTDPDMGVWNYSYDALGNLKWQLDARAQHICLYYDALNRLTGKEYRKFEGCSGTNLPVTFTYDQTTDGNKGVGRRTAMNDLSGSTTWKYDERGRLLDEVKSINGAGTFKTQWTYNPADQVATMTYPGGADGSAGEVVTNTYNPQMVLSGVAGTDTYLNSTNYDASGRVTKRLYDSLGEQFESFTYNNWSTSLGLLQRHEVRRGLTFSLLNLAYTYDGNGNILTINDSALAAPQTQTFTYDTLNRLTSAKACLTSTPATCDYNDPVYAYDNYGRLTTRPGGGTLTYNPNHIHAVTSVLDTSVTPNVTSSSYSYDANGNTVARNDVPVGSTTKNYILGYDAENRLVDVSKDADANFIYDGDGNRVLGTVRQPDSSTFVSTVYIGNYYEAQLGQPAQRIKNSSFENAGATGASSANWTEEGLNSLFPATSFFRSPWGLGVGNNGAYGQSISNLAYGIIRSDIIPVTPGAQYDLRAYVRGRIDPEESVVGWHIRAFFYDANNNWVGQVDAAASKAITETWQQQGGIVTVPANASKLRIGLYAVEISGWVAFDDVNLIRVGDSTNTNMVGNASFEQATNWSEFDETGGKFPGTGYFHYGWGIATPHTGSYAYAISNLAYNVLQADLITLEPNAQYDLYTYVRGALDPSVTAGTWILRARYFDAAGNYISISNIADSSPLTTTWQRFGGRFTPPANAAKIQIQLYNYMSSGWVAFDDVSLVKVGGNGANLVLNPGFETGNDILPANWTKSGEASSSFPASSYWRGSWGVAEPHSGAVAYATGNLMYGDLKADLVAAQPNTQYDLSVYVQGYRDLSASRGYPILRVVALDSNNTQLVWTVNNVTWLDLADSGIANSFSYKKYGGRFTTPANTVKLRVEVHFFMATGWVTFDDVSLTPVQSSLASFTKYYYAGSQRIARRVGTGSVEYLFGDHLGSSSVVVDSNFFKTSEMRYTAWGKPRLTTGTAPAANAFTYTGQRQEAGIALNFYNARWYDPNIAHFAQADTVIPEDSQGTQAWDRYAYANNNSVKYNDPTGHCIEFCDQTTIVFTNVNQAIAYLGKIEARIWIARHDYSNDWDAVSSAIISITTDAVVGGAAENIIKTFGLSGLSKKALEVLATLTGDEIQNLTNHGDIGMDEFRAFTYFSEDLLLAISKWPENDPTTSLTITVFSSWVDTDRYIITLSNRVPTNSFEKFAWGDTKPQTIYTSGSRWVNQTVKKISYLAGMQNRFGELMKEYIPEDVPNPQDYWTSNWYD
jgi:RHS repeat-associated protein